MLKSLGVDVYFEEGNIHSLGADSELILTLLASLHRKRAFRSVKTRNGASAKVLNGAR